jgi:hypothetical protein
MLRDVMNAGISLVTVLLMSLIYFNVVGNQRPTSLVYKLHQGTAAAWLFVFAFWAILLSVGEKAVLAIWLLDNVAKLCLFGTAIAYCRGSKFNPEVTLIVLILLLIILSAWETGFWWASGIRPNSMLLVALRLAPDVMLSGIGIVAIGWVFFVRWGGLFGWFFLLVTIAYSAFQLPATLMLGFDRFLTKTDSPDLDISFSALAGGKILLIFGFLSLICSSATGLELNEPRVWPENSVASPRWMRHLIGWVGSLAIAVIAGVISEKVKDLHLF